MFDMQQIGKEISRLRKEKDMTQMELADKLGISYQAVSNWERGNSMPDIAKLPELADIFDISLDELLGEKATLVEAVVNDTIAECMEGNPISESEIDNVLPILKPSQVNTMAENSRKINMNNIQMFLPFMSENDVREIAIKAFEEGQSVQMFLPFMKENDVNELAVRHLYKKQ